jgi:hypothetical protein
MSATSKRKSEAARYRRERGPNTNEIAKMYRLLLEGSYLTRFNEQVDGLDFLETMKLGQALTREQLYSPEEDCNCSGPNDAPGCPVCATSASEVYTEEF